MVRVLVLSPALRYEACQASPSRGFPRQSTLEWAAISTSRGSSLPGLSPSTASPALAGIFLITEAPGRPH